MPISNDALFIGLLLSLLSMAALPIMTRTEAGAALASLWGFLLVMLSTAAIIVVAIHRKTHKRRLNFVSYELLEPVAKAHHRVFPLKNRMSLEIGNGYTVRMDDLAVVATLECDQMNRCKFVAATSTHTVTIEITRFYSADGVVSHHHWHVQTFSKVDNELCGNLEERDLPFTEIRM